MDARSEIRDLLAAARGGAPDALGRIFEAARGHLLQIAHRELPAAVRAKIGPSDIVQETALDLQRGFAGFHGTTPEELFAWLRGILRNNLVDAVRRHRDGLMRNAAREVSLASAFARGAGETLAETDRPPDGSAIRREEAAALHGVLERLPVDYRRVLELRYWKGLSFVDMAPQLGRSPDAARKLWYRAVERLHDELARAADAAEDAPAPPLP